MSWQAYIDTSLVGSGHIDKGAIISAAGDSVWAASPGFTIKPEEMKTIADILEGKDGAESRAYSDGIHVAGERYVATIISSADKVIMIRKGKTGIAITKTNQAIVIGHYGESATASNARTTVEALGDYLKKMNY